MTVSELISYIRQDIVDKDKAEFSDEELINYINTVINMLNLELARLKYRGCIKEEEVTLTNN